MPVEVQSTYGVTLTAGSAVAEVISITPPQSKIGSIQVTNLSSPNQVHTFIAGYEDAGEMTFECNLTDANFAALNAIAVARTESAFVIAIPAPISFSITVNGFITSRGISSIAVGDELIKCTFTVKVSGICYPD
jgi:hypothetical protein